MNYNEVVQSTPQVVAMDEESVKLCSGSDSGSAKSLKHVSQFNSGLTTKEKVKSYCKLRYKFRKLKNKGALIALLWNYLVTGTFFFLKNTGNLQLVALGLTLPLAGWLADVWLGRYKAIRFSIWIIWITVMLITASSVVSQFVKSYSNISSYIQEVLTIIANIGLGGFLANITQFGLDQLHDSSTNEITSFIIWLVWTYSMTGYTAYFAVNCVPDAFSMLAMCIYLSTALSSIFVFDHMLLKEPSNKNPFKLIYGVVKYAIKNKRPTFRSAFTYSEDYLPSRIDFGKSKYGGPFTTEQVEDVKTFFRIIACIAIVSIPIGGVIGAELLLSRIYYNIILMSEEHQHCNYKNFFMQTLIVIGVIIIPLNELFFYPLFHRCLAFIGSQRKVILGILLLVVTIVTLMVLDIAAQNSLLVNSNITNINNYTLTVHTLDYRWITMSCVFKSLSAILIVVGAMEFLASQSPYSMRGVIMGTTYGLLSLSVALWKAISIPFTQKLSIWGTGVISGRFWYGLLLLITEMVVGTILIAAFRWYKKRKREDVLPNEHIFAERYYGTDNET